MNRTWLPMIGLGIAAMTTACMDNGTTPSPAPSPDPTPTQPSYAAPSFTDTIAPLLAKEPHDLRVEWFATEGSLLACGVFGLCPDPVEFTVVSAECTHCVLTDPSPGTAHDGAASFVITPSAAGDVHVQVMIQSTQTRNTRAVDYESTADAYRGLDVGCYVVTAAAPQQAAPCGATRAADDKVVFTVAGAMVSGQSSYIEPADLARVTIAGTAAVVWTGPVLTVAESNTQLADVVSASGALPASVVVAWTDGAGELLSATVAIPAIVP